LEPIGSEAQRRKILGKVENEANQQKCFYLLLAWAGVASAKQEHIALTKVRAQVSRKAKKGNERGSEKNTWAFFHFSIASSSLKRHKNYD